MQLKHLLDVAERLVVVLLASAFMLRIWPTVFVHPQYFLLVVQELFIITMVLIRPWGQDLATRPYPVLIAFLGTIFPLLVSTVGYRPDLASSGGVVMFVGVLMSVSAKFALNRRFGIIPANRGIQSRGPYALVRHPIYAGYTVTHIGFLLVNPVWWNFLVYALGLAFQVLRIFEEEKVLGEDQGYRTYSQRVRYRLVPGLF